MRHRTKTLVSSTWLTLTCSTNPKTGRKHYIVNMTHAPKTSSPFSIISEVRELFDPGRNRGPARGHAWKFRNRAEAEQLITVALLTWGD